MYHILLNSELQVVKQNLAPFIVNNFYCNYLSGNYMENNLLYVITMMLKDEINKLASIHVDNFLENSKCGFLLEELQKMPDIQIFFKKVIQKTVEIIERTSSSREIKFNIDEKQNELIRLKNAEEKKMGKNIEKNEEEIYKKIINSRFIDQSINHSTKENCKKVKERNDEFIKKYIPNITINDMKNLCENAKEQKKHELFQYFQKLENDINSNNDIYSNQMIMKSMFETKLPTHILTFYQNDFLEVVSFIEQILNDLNNNILLLPNSIINSI